LRLNVGCSIDTWGDVRLDIAGIYHRAKSKANIYADAQNIPFRDMTFEETKAWNILEHLPQWRLAICEWCRVTEKKLEIEVPIDAGMVNQEIFAKILSLDFHSLLELRNRRREHLWKFNPYAIIGELKKNDFSAELFFELAPLVFRDDNRLAKNRIFKLIRKKQKKLKFGYRIVAYRQRQPV
jgi:hypothetical protein